MKPVFLATISTMALSIAAHAAPPADFGGDWRFDAQRSVNVGGMAQASVDETIRQTSAQLIVDDNSVFAGRTFVEHIVYDLTGAPVSNKSQMGGDCTASSNWVVSRLETEWVCPGAIAGAVNRRHESRYLADGGTTMFVESIRANSKTVRIAFERK
jgi:hypothetical protein